VRILMVLHAPPSPGELGPGRRHRHLLRQLAKRHRVSILSFGTPADHQRFLDEFGSRCETAVFCDMTRARLHDVAVRLGGLLLGRSEFWRLHRPHFQRALDALLATRRFDLVIFSTTMLGCYRVPGGIPVVGDTHNVEHDSLRRAAVAAREFPRQLYYRAQATLTAREETRYNRSFSAVWATSPRDASLIAAGRPLGPVHVVPNGIELSRYAVTRAPEEATLLFTGLMSYYPNRHGALHFIEHIFPLIEARLPAARLLVVGASPPHALRRAARSNVEITGYVPSVEPYFRRATAFVAPLEIGGGTRVKVLEALAYGVPVISTTIGCEGLDVVDGQSVLLADTPSAFAQAVLRVLLCPSLARALSANGHAIARTYDWERIGEQLDALCRQVVTRGVGAPIMSQPSSHTSVEARA
jgi:polysaccharide biosynthesis protein PslH